MTISKDQSIITQVAAKIAADLTPNTDDVMTNISNWLLAFDATTEALLEKHNINGIVAEPTASAPTVDEAVNAVMQAFPNTTPVSFEVRIKGKQHGPIPTWLHSACAEKGVTEVWDNRDGLAVNPKRPWFKSTTGTEAFWAPKGSK
jgi:hypothetical protein